MMTTFTSTHFHRRKPSVTLASSSVRSHLTDLVYEAHCHRAIRHPYLSELAAGTLPNLRWALTDFARHYYGYSAYFPRFLTTVVSRLDAPAHREALMQNLMEESGCYSEEELAALAHIGIKADWIVGIPHPQLFQRFRAALGLPDRDWEPTDLEVICWREMLLSILTHGSAAEAVGALGLGTESIVSECYRAIVQALSHLGDLPARDTVFFSLHTLVDDAHQETLLDIATLFAQTPEGLRELQKGMRKALALRSAFWDWLYARALAPEEIAA
ncbi:MAG: TenA family transcriptional regulator [Leptolyngbyaceae cyanobacterium]